MNAIKVNDLKKSYKDKLVLNGINLSVEAGEIFGLLGRNGAGKSTAIECILNTKDYDSGDVLVLDLDPRIDRKDLFQKVGVQFQGSNYQEKIKVAELCEMNCALYDEVNNYDELLHNFGLANHKKAYVQSLSGGEKQKLSIVLALIPKPKIVFLDELTTGLDPQSRHDVWNYLAKLKEEGLTIFLTSHYMDEVEALCDRVAILGNGKIIVEGSPREIIELSGKDTLEKAYLYYVNEGENFNESI